VFFLFIAHLFDDRPTFRIFFGKVVQMAVQMRADLLFRLRNEAETPFVAQLAAGCAYRFGAGLPQRTQTTRLVTQFM
jgi:hypothetical protein